MRRKTRRVELASRPIQNLELNNEVVRRITRKKKYFVNKLLHWSKDISISYPWRKTDNPYKILLSEFLLRKTKADKVAEVYPNLLTKYPSLRDLNKAEIEDIRFIINPLGLGKTRTTWMKKCVSEICQRFGDQVSRDVRMYEALNKNQKYLKAALQCFAYEENTAVFDVNVSRIIERMFSVKLGKESHKKALSWDLASILVPEKLFKEYNWALLDLGRLVCKARDPNCPICPVKKLCDFARNQCPSAGPC
jgi:A/G-specific adenine glycosylase